MSTVSFQARVPSGVDGRRATGMRAAVAGLAAAVAAAGFLAAGTGDAGRGAVLGSGTSAPAGPTLTLVAPAEAAPGETVTVAVRAEGLDDATAVQATLLHPAGTATVSGGRWESERLGDASGLLRTVAPVSTPAATTMAAWSCTAPDCLESAPALPSTPAELFTVEAEVPRSGALDLRLDDVVVVGADGQPMAVTVRDGSDGGGSIVEPRGPAVGEPADLTGDGSVDLQDAGEAEMEWFQAVEAGTACEQSGSPVDANGDGCLDVRDLQAYDPVLSATGSADAGGATRASGMPIGALAAVAPVRTFTVDSAGDQDDAAGDGVCRTSVGTCTLRAALTEARRVAGHDLILFAIPGPGPHVLTPQTALPFLSDPDGVTIDGYSQPGAQPNTAAHGSNADIRIALVGTGSGGIDGLVVPSPGAHNDVRGLSLRQFRRAVWFHGTGTAHNRVTGSFLGIAPDGTGGATTTVTGSHGVNIQAGASDNVVGTPALADRNVLSGNGQHGLATYDNGTTRNVIQNNVVGLNPAGTAAVPNRSHGIDINTWTTDTRIGGTRLNEGNVVSGNRDEGIEISHGRGTLRNDVVGNLIGTAVDGTSAPTYARNTRHGIRLEGWGSCNPCPRDAGHSRVHDNVVVNAGAGAILADKGFHSSVVERNRIGILRNGTVVPSGRYGVQINHGAMDIVVRDNTVTGVQNGLQVTGVGYLPDDPVPVDTFGHTFSRNAVYGISPGLGIDLAPFGSVNTSTNAEPTANRGVLAPKIGTVTAETVSGVACPDCTVEVFESDRAAGTVGSGRRYVSTVVADGAGRFTAALDADMPGQVVTTTATLPTGDTSEFSRNSAVPLTSPENSPPVASFTASCTDLTCSFDASGSSDTDGTVARYDWDFGDATTGTGRTATRTYASAGSYTVRLTVTDDRGATGTASTVVKPTAPAMRELVRDPFSRNVAEGWGTAGTGGSYTHAGGTAGMSVRGGVGLVVSSADNASRGARLPIRAVDQDLRITVSGDQVPTGSGYTTQLLARTVSGSQEYRLRLRFSGNGQGYLTVMKRGASPAEVAVGNEVAVPGLTHEVGAAYILRATVTGTSPTTLRMKAWRAGTTQPGWQLTRTDDEPALQAPGGVGVRTFMPTSMTNRPLTQRFDNFIVQGR